MSSPKFVRVPTAAVFGLLAPIMLTATTATPSSALPVSAAQQPVLYVAKSGRADAPGTSKQPLSTIGAAVARASNGQRIVVRAGRYHESVVIEGERHGLRLEAAPGAKVWLDGATRVGGWAKQGGAWVRKGWNHEFDHSPTYVSGVPDGSAEYWQFINRKHPMAAHPDQVWVNGVRQRQVSRLGLLRSGTFYHDEAGNRLYLGKNPSGHAVTASTLQSAIQVRSNNVDIRGIGVRGYATSVPQMGAVTLAGDGARYAKSRLTRNATTALHVTGDRVRLIGLRLDHNGMKGLGATYARGLRLTRLRVDHNNIERFNFEPSAGGAKIGRSRNIKVVKSKFTRNHGTGLWFDESSYRIRVVRSRFSANQRHGLSLEISGKALVAGNVVSANSHDGIRVNDVDNVQIWNNTIRGSRRPLNIVQDRRDLDPGGSFRDPSLPLTWRNKPVSIRNNVITGATARTECLVCVEDYSRRWSGKQLQTTAQGNVYGRRGTRPEVLLRWPGSNGKTLLYRGLGKFRKAQGQETRGTVRNERALTPGRLTSTLDALAPTTAVPVASRLARLMKVTPQSKVLGAPDA